MRSVPAATKAIQNRSFPASTPVMIGPAVAANVLSILVMPIIAVRSSDFTAAAMNADCGAWSILFRLVRRKNRAIVRKMLEGAGKRRTAVDEGRCVNTMVLMRPRRRDRGPAATVKQYERK